MTDAPVVQGWTGRSPTDRTSPRRAILHDRPEAVPQLRGLWQEALCHAPYFCATYDDHYRPLPLVETGRHVIATVPTEGEAGIVLPFRQARDGHPFMVGEARLLRLSALSLALSNPWLAEGHAARDVAVALRETLAAAGAVFLDTGEIPNGSAVEEALRHARWPFVRLQLGRKTGLRWLIDLPGSFDAYLGALPRKERRNLNWKMRRIEREFEVRVETFTTAESVERFLQEGERISRMTYQWRIGQKLRNDAPTRAHYRALADEGRLRCHLLYLDGKACAFSRGVVQGDLYLDDTPGYDPAYARYSVGTVLLLHCLRSLIEDTPCRVFDFGTGGDLTGFKSRFGNRSIPCNSYYLLDMRRPRAVAIWLGETALSRLKNLADKMVRDPIIRGRVRRWLRRHGDGGSPG